MSEKRNWQMDWELAEHATPGPWGFARGDRLSGVAPHIVQLDADGAAAGTQLIAQVGPNVPLHYHDYDAQCYKDAQFIAEAREALPYWLQRVRELEEEKQRLREVLKRHQEHAKSCKATSSGEGRPDGRRALRS